MRLPADLDARSLSDQGVGDCARGQGHRVGAHRRGPAGRDRPSQGAQRPAPDQAERHGEGQPDPDPRACGGQTPAQMRQERRSDHSRGAHHQGRARPARLALQRLPDLPGSGSRAAPPCRAPAARALAHPGRADHHGRHALRDCRPFRAGPAPLRVGAVPPGPSQHPAAARTALQPRLRLSKRQLVRFLIAGQDWFVDEARAVLRAGLSGAAWISVDDTGARHRGANQVCTQIGNDHFTWFGTTESKSRLNFLELLRAGHTDYVVNPEALAYMRSRALAGPVIAKLASHPTEDFADEAAWRGHLARLGLGELTVSPDPVRIATEGALWGAIKAHGFLPDTVIVSDDAGQFMVGRHALCWVHAERLVHKLDAFTDEQRAAQQHMRCLIWWFYRDLKAYAREPSARRRTELRARFGRIFHRRTGFVMLDRLLKRLQANKAELLMVLERPEVPLHTNHRGSGIRLRLEKRLAL